MDADLTLRAVGLGKDYRIGVGARGYTTLRERVVELARSPLRRLSPARAPQDDLRILRALDEVSFEIPTGETVAFIGHNGAGKSTLLKLASRITPPTRGSLEVRGRVGSLLEVGTGFHPELTGRENVFLNGAVLGMSRAEIVRQFDRIVEFSGVERFLDTPVKRYSSGMNVRLAFSVAAHLDPEVLLIDEVLAVGDSAFQRKCLERMQAVAREGRTVVFVSHNMAILSALCTRGIVLQTGRVLFDGPLDTAVSTYLRQLDEGSSADLLERADRRGWHQVLVSRITVSGSSAVIRSGEDMAFEIEVTGRVPDMGCRLILYNQLGQPVTTLDSGAVGPEDVTEPGTRFRCEVDALGLTPGRYRIDVTLRGAGHLQDELPAAAYFDVEPGLVGGRPVLPGALGDVVVAQRWLTPGN